MDKQRYIEVKAALREIIRGTIYQGKTYCVGGCVRDDLLGLDIKDIDLVIEMKDGGTRFAEWLEIMGYITRPPVLYPTYGTSMFVLPEFPDIELEAVQTRSEKYLSRDSRNPTVKFGSIMEDCNRRDLTVNALYENISTGEIHDFTGRGLQDLQDKIIRTTADPQIIFDDDPLRILRCIRFSVKLGWDISEETWDGVCKDPGRLEIISQERVTSELDKILGSHEPARGLELLRTSGVLNVILPELTPMITMEQNKYHLGTVWEHTLKVIENLRGLTDDVDILWAGVLHDIGKLRTKEVDEDGSVHFLGHAEESATMSEEIGRRLKFSVARIERIKSLVRLHMDFKHYAPDTHDLKNKKLRKYQYNLGPALFYDLLKLIEADNMAHAPEYCIYGQTKALEDRTKEMINSGTCMFGYKLPVSGLDIMRYKEISPGPLVKVYLDYLMKLAFVNPKLSKDELLGKIKNMTPKKLGYDNTGLVKQR